MYSQCCSRAVAASLVRNKHVRKVDTCLAALRQAVNDFLRDESSSMSSDEEELAMKYFASLGWR